ncbi:hypothetical protein [Bifidobacterium avesanii]|uniref:hypothetical protein n=1 Tax=Bifidobacterium avesanii TaxID=1798157 RepID=UPI001EF99796|nr:hypothetical protein [Bifidobacterium avesanii]
MISSIISLTGLVNRLALPVFERTNEISMLRALGTSPLVSWSIAGFFIVAGLPISSDMFENSPMLYAVIPTTWLLSGAVFAGYVIPVGVVVATASVWLLLKAVKRV